MLCFSEGRLGSVIWIQLKYNPKVLIHKKFVILWLWWLFKIFFINLRGGQSKHLSSGAGAGGREKQTLHEQGAWCGIQFQDPGIMTEQTHNPLRRPVCPNRLHFYRGRQFVNVLLCFIGFQSLCVRRSGRCFSLIFQENWGSKCSERPKRWEGMRF